MTESLAGRYRGFVCDLDGVVYAGPSAIDHAVDALESIRTGGGHIVYATNNASRPPSAVASHLRELGLGVRDDDVVNSSMAGAHVLAASVSSGARVLAIGGEGVSLALEDAGFDVVGPADDWQGCAAVLQGYGPDVRASDLAATAYAISRGATWVATNTDLTLPTAEGIAPGNGSLVGAVRNAVDGDPMVAGKPEPVMYEMAARRMSLDASEVIAIGDRLETDIEGANRGGFDSVLVLTGVHGLTDAASAGPERRPTFVLKDLRGLSQPYVVEDVDESTLRSSATLTIEQARGALVATWARVDAGTMEADEARALFRGRVIEE